MINLSSSALGTPLYVSYFLLFLAIRFVSRYVKICRHILYATQFYIQTAGSPIPPPIKGIPGC